LIALAAWLCSPTVVLASEQVASEPSLTRIEVDRLDEVFVKPGVNWQQYTHVLLEPLDMSATEIKAPAGTHKRDIKPLTDKQKQDFDTSYRRAFIRELIEDDAFMEAHQPQPFTLRIQAKLLTLAPTYIPDSRVNISGRNKVYTETAGKIEMAFEISDAGTGEVLARVSDERSAMRMWRQNTALQNRSQVNQIMGTWARIFRNHLDDVAGR
jgi:hypothetical protein